MSANAREWPADVDACVLRRNVRFKLANRVLQHEIEIYGTQRDIAAGNLTECEEILRQLVHAARCDCNTTRVIDCRFVQRRGAVFKERLAEAMHCTERRAKVV